MIKFNQGKACDAVIRRIEMREGSRREDIKYPEKDRNAALDERIELACQIGGQLFAFEHTGIEPFEGYAELEAKFQNHFAPVVQRLSGTLPKTEDYELLIPVAVTLKLTGRDIKRIQDILVGWIETTAPTLPIARAGRYLTPIKPVSLPCVPFEVSLHRRIPSRLGGGRFYITHRVSPDLEEGRVERTRRAYTKKMGKLAAWRQRYGARTILVLEENDVIATRDDLVADAILCVEQEISDKPDEVYLVSTGISSVSWFMSAMRILPLRLKQGEVLSS